MNVLYYKTCISELIREQKIYQLGSHKRDYLGRPHCDDGPAIDLTDSQGIYLKIWHNNGLVHRIGGPAIETDEPLVSPIWCQYDCLHRTNGPALGENTYPCWFLEGKQYLFDEWFELTKFTDEQEKIFCYLKWK